MIKLQIRPIKLRKWFPPNDPLAATLARLVILREDFLLEAMGLEAENIPQLDTSTKEWRRLYLLRQSIRTLFEIRSAIEELHRQVEFRRILSNQSEEKRDKFARLLRDFNHAHRLLKEIRNSVGGHVQQNSVQAALNEMNWDRWGFLEIGQTGKDTHYRFAGELLVAILMAGVPEDQQHTKVESDIQTIASLVSVFTLIEDIILMYVEERKLLS